MDSKTTLSTGDLLDLLASEYPLRKPENRYRVNGDGTVDVRNSLLGGVVESFNESSSFIFLLCDGRNSIVDIWKKILDAYDVPDNEETLSQTVRTIRYMQKQYLLSACTLWNEQATLPRKSLF